MPQDKLLVVRDVYNLTIAANMTKRCTATELNYSLKFCFTVFIIQIGMAYGFIYEWFDLNDYEPFDLGNCFLRLLMALLMSKEISGELM